MLLRAFPPSSRGLLGIHVTGAEGRAMERRGRKEDGPNALISTTFSISFLQRWLRDELEREGAGLEERQGSAAAALSSTYS